MSRNAHADDLIRFLNDSPTPYHAVEAARQRLSAAGAKILDEETLWQLKAGECAFVIRGGSIAAVRIPANFSSAQPASFHIVAAHTDSPGLRLKPRPQESTHQYQQWGVEVYGGVLFNSWLDRDLGIAGRVSQIGGRPEFSSSHLDTDGDTEEKRIDQKSKLIPKLIRFEDHPIRIAQLAIHLDRKVNEEGLVLNPQKNLVPILGQTPGPDLKTVLVETVGAPFEDLSFDLCLYDRTPACYGGMGDEFIYSGRLDNLAMSHAALSAFIESPSSNVIQVIALFDHEEIGSVSAQGAESNFLSALLERVGITLGMNRETWLASLPQSFMISADMAHGIHPNYPDKHEPDHFPIPNRGVVLKSNIGHRYASDGVTAARFLGWARQAGIATQNFLSRADLACGSTVGPGLSAQLGIPTVDVGMAMLSMHSAREMCGADDSTAMIGVMKEFFRG